MKPSQLGKALLVVSLLFVGAKGFAQQVFLIPMGNQYYSGQNTIPLKQEIRSHYGLIQLKDYSIDRVELVAKSQFGSGTAVLRVGPTVSYQQTVFGTPQNFNVPQDYTFEHVTLVSTAYGASQLGPWQVTLNGSFVVQRVIVYAHQVYYHPVPPPPPYHRHPLPPPYHHHPVPPPYHHPVPPHRGGDHGGWHGGPDHGDHGGWHGGQDHGHHDGGDHWHHDHH